MRAPPCLLWPLLTKSKEIMHSINRPWDPSFAMMLSIFLGVTFGAFRKETKQLVWTEAATYIYNPVFIWKVDVVDATGQNDKNCLRTCGRFSGSLCQVTYSIVQGYCNLFAADDGRCNGVPVTR